MLVLTAATAADDAHPFDEAVKVETRRFQLEYRVNPDSQPLTRVDLWYSIDSGQTWHNYGPDPDQQSPIEFDAADEGPYGFYFVISNEWGTSAAAPQTGTVPHHRAFVDYTPPVLQLRPVIVDNNAGERIVRLRWSALDAHFDARPIALAYRMESEGDWRSIAAPVANTGSYDWNCPGDLEGRMSVRVTAVDRGGHRVDAAASDVEMVRRQRWGAPVGSLASAGPIAASQPAEGDVARALKVFQRGAAHQERGEYRLAMSRFRDALAIDPVMTEALVHLGETMYFQREYSESAQAFRLALEQEPSWLRARRGLARSLVGAQDYERAAAELGLLLDADPRDAEAWLELGDVALWRGDEALAREGWRRAESVDGGSDEVAEKARARLMDIEGRGIGRR